MAVCPVPPPSPAPMASSFPACRRLPHSAPTTPRRVRVLLPNGVPLLPRSALLRPWRAVPGASPGHVSQPRRVEQKAKAPEETDKDLSEGAPAAPSKRRG